MDTTEENGTHKLVEKAEDMKKLVNIIVFERNTSYNLILRLLYYMYELT